MASVVERVAAARARLEAAGLAHDDAALDAEILARHALGWDRASFLAHRREPEPRGFETTFEALVSRRARREPVSQIVGVREFWGLDFEVSSDVLTPRPETEIIVEEAIEFARDHPCRHIIDVGTGSGCLAVAIARELPAARVTAVDASAAALAIAQRNAARHAVADRITFLSGDLLEGSSGLADLIVSNPPYIPDAEAFVLQPEVVQYEPRAALFGGPTGLEVIRRLLEHAAAHLADQGRLIVEFGFGQAGSVARLAEDTGWQVVRLREDLQGVPRTLVARPVQPRQRPEGDENG
jgi:release factor glutamine methyltransferase